MRLFRIRHRDRDRGSTLLVALMVMSIAAMLGAVVVKVSIDANANAGLDRQHVVGNDAAEGGVDATFAAIQQAGLNLPCSWPLTGTTNMKAYPDTTSVSATITYYDAAGVLTNPATPLSCPPGGTLPTSAQPVKAVINSTATMPKIVNAPNAAVQHMQAYVALDPVRAQGLTSALYANQTITLTQNTHITGHGGNVYSSQDVVCDQNATVEASLLAPNGSIHMKSNCHVAEDAWAKGSVDAASNVTVSGRVIASTGNITTSSNVHIGGTLMAAGTIGYTDCSIPNKCFPNTSSAPPPATQPFPHILGDASTLSSAWSGWTVKRVTTCSSLLSIVQTYAATTGNTLISTPCEFQMGSNSEVDVNGNLAIFADGGFDFSSNTKFKATGSHNVYIVVPTDSYDGVTNTCNSGGDIDMSSNTFFDTNINVLFYTPCDVNESSNFHMTGQVYANGQISLSSNAITDYAQLPLPIGAVDPTTLPPLAYTVGIIFKRQMAS